MRLHLNYYEDFISISDAKTERHQTLRDIVVVGYGIKDARYDDYEDHGCDR